MAARCENKLSMARSVDCIVCGCRALEGFNILCSELLMEEEVSLELSEFYETN